jgi:diaminohydroxyphosphoribosylaminopyrimidine deaminase/5-amino-6-(5-phosphoribosylamino)uracil reductase
MTHDEARDAPAPAVSRDDEQHMRRAIDQVTASTAQVAPNPLVGAVVVASDGTVAGAAATIVPDHAEPQALAVAGDRARGGTLYVTLEPCDHHGRTPPCTEAVIAAGVRRVVVAVDDPDPKVAGAGIARLRAAGIDVVTGVCRDEAAASLTAYLHQRRTGLPLCVVKLAMTIDGRTAAPDGSSQWITGPAARDDVHRLRRGSDAVMVGSGTVLADDPRLTARTTPVPPRQPLRVVVDRRGRVATDAAVFDGDAPLLVVTSASASARQREWRDAGAEVLVADSLRDVMAELGQRGCLQVLVEGGATLAGSVLRAGLVDQLVVYVGAAVAGGDDAVPVLAGPSAASVEDFGRWRLDDVARLDDDVRLRYSPRR